jgi:pimeloyl-ACP methyl ester carboxylesterase
MLRREGVKAMRSDVTRATWATFVLLAGCSLGGSPTIDCPPGEDCATLQCQPDDLECLGQDGSVPTMGALGKACSSSDECLGVLRLSCVEGKCDFSSDLTEGSTCNATAECKAGLYCAAELDRTCQKAGDGAAGARCGDTGECMRGLVCSYTGLTKTCAPSGSGDLGSSCSSTSDCLAGLFCPPPSDRLPEPVCITLPDTIPELTWAGPACEKDEGPATAYFRVPRGNAEDKDFFRLPFPNDVRRTATGINLSSPNFPTPGNLLGLGDVIARYATSTASQVDGFATNPVVYFRFSKAYDGATVSESTVLLVDIDPDSPDYGRDLTRSWGTSSGQITSYVCENWLNVRTASGSPLRPGTTYAVVLTRGITPKGGGSFARSKDLDALLSEATPSDATLAAAHAAYAPLRAYVSADKLSADDVLNAAVFTTQEPRETLSSIAAAIAAESAIPKVKDVTICDAGVKSPCDDGGDRVCDARNDDYVEIHGRISLPIFQRGTAPYEMQGGDIAGEPVRNEDVCFGLSLPRTAAPEAGFPVVIHAHGTGGSFKSGLRDLSAFAAEAGAAVLSLDLPQHGSRKNGSTRGSDELFYNFLNPDAALGNVAQGSADLLSLVAFAKGVDEPATSAFGRALKFDAARIALFGHSQGATHAALALPYANEVTAAVLSGVGGDLSDALTTKTSPLDIAGVMPLLIADPSAAPYDKDTCKTCVGSHHPVYGLLQTFFERVDPVNFGALLRRPGEGMTSKHVFMLFGIGDTYSPDPTQRAYAISASLAHVGPELSSIYSAGAVPAPVVTNVSFGDSAFTQGVRQYAPAANQDGHFVYQSSAETDWQRFLRAALTGQGAPQIGD